MRGQCPVYRRAFPAAILLTTSGLSLGAHINVTIGDKYGDSMTGAVPIYNQNSGFGWIQGADCNGCSGAAKPDPSQAFNGTWHDATWEPKDGSPRTIQVSFEGQFVIKRH